MRPSLRYRGNNAIPPLHAQAYIPLAHSRYIDCEGLAEMKRPRLAMLSRAPPLRQYKKLETSDSTFASSSQIEERKRTAAAAAQRAAHARRRHDDAARRIIQDAAAFLDDVHPRLLFQALGHDG